MNARWLARLALLRRVARYLDGRASFRAARSALDTALLLAWQSVRGFLRPRHA